MDKIPSALLEVLEKLSPQQQRQFACDCAEHVLFYFEQLQPLDKRPRTAIEVARRYVLGDADQKVLTKASADAESAAWEAGDIAWKACEAFGTYPQQFQDEAAASEAVVAEACSCADLEKVVEGAVNTALEAVVIAAVGGQVANAIWIQDWASVPEAVLQRYREAQTQERTWQLEQASRYVAFNSGKQ